MYDSENDIEIDEYTYLVIADVLRKNAWFKAQ